MRPRQKLVIYAALLLICSQILLQNHVFAAKISYYVKPARVEKGRALLVVFKNLNKKKEYILKVSEKKKYEFRLGNIKRYTEKLLGVSLGAPDKLSISLLENGEVILEDQILLHGIKTEVSHITIKKEYVSPPKTLSTRIWKEHLRKQKAKAITIKERYFYREPVFPVVDGVPGTPFGYKRIYNKWKKGIHYGTDISAPLDTPIKSIFRGKVVLAGDLYYTGNTVMLHHGDGFISLYAHMNEIHVEKDQIIEKGTVIGTIGSTGRSTGPHLHLGVYINEIAVDPMSLFEVLKAK